MKYFSLFWKSYLVLFLTFIIALRFYVAPLVYHPGSRGCKRNPKSFDLVKIREKSLEIWAKSLKIFTKSLKIWANSWKYEQEWVQKFKNASELSWGKVLFIRVLYREQIMRHGWSVTLTNCYRLFGLSAFSNRHAVLRKLLSVAAETEIWNSCEYQFNVKIWKLWKTWKYKSLTIKNSKSRNYT